MVILADFRLWVTNLAVFAGMGRILFYVADDRI